MDKINQADIMIEFIVSKMGILLFAVSVASILLLFIADIKDIFISDEGMQISSVISKKLKEMADSQSLCVSTYVSLPRYIDVIGSTSGPTNTSVYYYIDINIIPQENNDKFIVFSMINKKTKKVMSVESFITDAEVGFKYNNVQNDEGTYLYGEKNIRIDPTNTSIIYMVKINSVEQVVGSANKTIRKILFVPCTYDRSNPANPLQTCFDQLKIISKDEHAFCVPQRAPGTPSTTTS